MDDGGFLVSQPATRPTALRSIAATASAAGQRRGACVGVSGQSRQGLADGIDLDPRVADIAETVLRVLFQTSDQ